jgi:hypothetical protein
MARNARSKCEGVDDIGVVTINIEKAYRQFRFRRRLCFIGLSSSTWEVSP